MAQQVQEPVQGPPRHERPRPQLGQRAPLERRGARRRRRRGDLPEHGAAVLPELRAVRGTAEARGLRAPPRRHPRPQPLAGRLLRRVPGAARRHRADLPQRRRRRDRRREVVPGARPARRRPAPERPARRALGQAPLRPVLRPALGGVPGPRDRGRQPRRHRLPRLRRRCRSASCSTSPRPASTRSARSCTRSSAACSSASRS